MPSGEESFKRFLVLLRADGRTHRVAARLFGCDPRRIFVCLRTYLENSDRLNQETRAREKAHRKILRTAVRENGASPEIGLALHARADRAYDTKRKGTAHCVESLMWLRAYIAVQIGDWPGVSDLALLLEAAKEALGRRDIYTDRDALRKEIDRFKAKNRQYPLCLLEEYTSKS